MRALLPLALAALVGCGPAPQLGGAQPHGPPIASAGDWVPAAAAKSAVAGFPGVPFAGGGSGTNASTPVAGSSGAFGPGLVTTDGGFIQGAGGTNMAEFAANGGGAYVTKYSGVVLGVNTFPGLWMLGSGSTLSTANYALMAAGTLILNGTGSGIAFRDSNANKAGVDTTYGLTNAIAVGTAGSGTGITTIVTGAIRHYTHVITVARTNLTNASTTQDVVLWTVPARTRVRAVIADGTAAFDDAAGPISALTITCGKTAGGNEYLLSGSLFTVNTLGDVTGEVGASLTTYFGDIPSWSATTAIQCRFTSTGGNLSTLTTGSATFYLEMESLP